MRASRTRFGIQHIAIKTILPILSDDTGEYVIDMEGYTSSVNKITETEKIIVRN